MAVANELWISADSHMSEPPDLWQRELPPRLKDRAPEWPHIKIWEEAHYLRALACEQVSPRARYCYAMYCLLPAGRIDEGWNLT